MNLCISRFVQCNKRWRQYTKCSASPLCTTCCSMYHGLWLTPYKIQIYEEKTRTNARTEQRAMKISLRQLFYCSSTYRIVKLSYLPVNCLNFIRLFMGHEISPSLALSQKLMWKTYGISEAWQCAGVGAISKIWQLIHLVQCLCCKHCAAAAVITWGCCYCCCMALFHGMKILRDKIKWHTQKKRKFKFEGNQCMPYVFTSWNQINVHTRKKEIPKYLNTEVESAHRIGASASERASEC